MRKFSLIVCLALTMSAFMIACKQDDSGKQQARLLVANFALRPPLGSPLPSRGDSIDVRWDGSIIIPNVIYGSASITTGTPLSRAAIDNPLGVPSSSPLFNFPAATVAASYAQVKSGAFGLNFAVAGSSGTTIYDRTTSFLPGKSYSALSFDFMPFYKTLIMEDNLENPPAGKVKVRFVHTIPQALLASLPRRDTVDIALTGGAIANPLNGAVLFSTRSFGDAYNNTRLHQYAVIDSGSYNFAFRIAGSLISVGTIPSIRLREGKIYTVVARVHFPSLPTSAAGLTIITHN
ncbi:MAG: DUF4397 domain-containing protein [Chitinophagaceae bacterium]|nr:DUF4397 domain-containing protein [Chitinophagaceae bacterium]